MQGIEKFFPEHNRLDFPPEEKRITVAEYLLQKLHQLGVQHIHSEREMLSTPLLSVSYAESIQPVVWKNPKEVKWAAQNSSKCQGYSVLYYPEYLLPDLFDVVTNTADEMTPLLIILQRSLRSETKEVCGLPCSVKELGRHELRKLIRRLSATYVTLDDRRTAATHIDRTLDVSIELLQPVIIELPDEIACACIPPHCYKKTVFNYEEGDRIRHAWDTIISRLEQAQKALFVIGEQCWPPMWHHLLILLAKKYKAVIYASADLWGHIDPSLGTSIQRYPLLSHVENSKDFDSIFIFGVSADHPWLEMLLIHNDIYSHDQELFFLHSTGMGFGDGHDAIAAPPLREFFYKAPHVELSSTEVVHSGTKEHPLASLLYDVSCPLFSTHEDISRLLAYAPFAKIFIQPETASEQWFSVMTKSWHLSARGQMILVGGTGKVISQLFEPGDPFSCPILFLVYDREIPIEELIKTTRGTYLSNEASTKTWLENRKKPHGLMYCFSAKDRDDLT